MDKVVITVVGKDTIGILAKTCTYLADNGVNILDISQTIVQDYFNMMMRSDVPPKNEAIAHGTCIAPLRTCGRSATTRSPVPPMSVMRVITASRYSAVARPGRMPGR